MKSLELIRCCRPLGAEALDDEQAEATAAIFKALADPARVKIVNVLARSDGLRRVRGVALHRRAAE